MNFAQSRDFDAIRVNIGVRYRVRIIRILNMNRQKLDDKNSFLLAPHIFQCKLSRKFLWNVNTEWIFFSRRTNILFGNTFHSKLHTSSIIHKFPTNNLVMCTEKADLKTCKIAFLFICDNRLQTCSKTKLKVTDKAMNEAIAFIMIYWI